MKNLQKYTDFFAAGIKADKRGLLGVEVEHFIVDYVSGLTLPYSGGVEDILNEISHFYDQKIYSEKHLIALRRAHMLISLEPAGQLEVSIGEFFELERIEKEYNSFLSEISKPLEKRGLKLVTKGYHPLSKAKDMPLLPKERYRLMDKYFATSGQLGLYMMRGTAAVHATVDYFSEKDFVDKFFVANLLTPFLVHLTDNVSTFEGKKYNKRMLRHKIWTDVDRQRCGVVEGVNSFLDYAKFVCSNLEIVAAADNEIEHALSMVFPYVRLKGFIEIRAADSMPIDYVMGYLALIKGIFYQQEAIDTIIKQFKNVTASDIFAAFDSLTKYGYNAEAYELSAYPLYFYFFKLAANVLKGEELQYLKKLKMLVLKRKTMRQVVKA